MGNEEIIFQAAADGNLAKVEALLKRNPTLINLRDRHSKTPLHKTATVEIAGLLIRYGADVNARGWMGSTPLHEMTSKDRLDIAQLLIAHGANVNATRDYNITPLHWAKSIQMARLLLQHGAAVSPRDEGGKTPFQNAVLSGDLDFVNLFIEYGAEIQIVDNLYGQTPLHIVPNAQVLKRLLELGLPVNVASRTGNTPLLNAVTRGNKEMVQLLLDYGADVAIRNQHGINPVHLARQKAPEILNFLEQHMQIHNIDLYGIPENLSSKQLIVNAKRSEAYCLDLYRLSIRAQNLS